MKSVMAVEHGKGRQWGTKLRLFIFAMGVCISAMLLGGCSGRHPGETRVEIDRRHERALRLNNEMLLSDLDRALLFDRPSLLTDKRIP